MLNLQKVNEEVHNLSIQGFFFFSSFFNVCAQGPIVLLLVHSASIQNKQRWRESRQWCDSCSDRQWICPYCPPKSAFTRSVRVSFLYKTMADGILRLAPLVHCTRCPFYHDFQKNFTSLCSARWLGPYLLLLIIIILILSTQCTELFTIECASVAAQSDRAVRWHHCLQLRKQCMQG